MRDVGSGGVAKIVRVPRFGANARTRVLRPEIYQRRVGRPA